MNSKLKKLCDELAEEIQKAYEESVTVQESEKLAAKFLHAQIQLTSAIQIVDLDFRVKKSGTKALKAEVYLDAATQGDKKPSDTLLNNIVDSNDLVKASIKEQEQAEVDLNELRSYYDIFHEAHVFFRGIAKASFNG